MINSIKYSIFRQVNSSSRTHYPLYLNKPFFPVLTKACRGTLLSVRLIQSISAQPHSSTLGLIFPSSRNESQAISVLHNFQLKSVIILHRPNSYISIPHSSNNICQNERRENLLPFTYNIFSYDLN